MIHATTLVPADLARLARRISRDLWREWCDATDGGASGVHRSRVASRRLRALMPVAAVAATRDLRTLRRRLRQVTRALGRVRESDVTRALLAAEAAREGWPASTVARIDRALLGDRDARRREMLPRLDPRLMDAMALEIEALAVALDQAPPAAAAAAAADLAARLHRRARTLVTALDRAGTLYEPESLHAVRIAAKKLRYTLELAEAAAGGSVRAELRRLKQLQDLLGDLHDRQMLQITLQGAVVDARTNRRLETWIALLESGCRERHAAFLRRAAGLRDMAQELASTTPLRLVPSRAQRMSVEPRVSERRAKKQARS
jgi:CHAD domain-containing protein